MAVLTVEIATCNAQLRGRTEHELVRLRLDGAGRGRAADRCGIVVTPEPLVTRPIQITVFRQHQIFILGSAHDVVARIHHWASDHVAHSANRRVEARCVLRRLVQAGGVPSDGVIAPLADRVDLCLRLHARLVVAQVWSQVVVDDLLTVLARAAAVAQAFLVLGCMRHGALGTTAQISDDVVAGRADQIEACDGAVSLAEHRQLVGRLALEPEAAYCILSLRLGLHVLHLAAVVLLSLDHWEIQLPAVRVCWHWDILHRLTVLHELLPVNVDGATNHWLLGHGTGGLSSHLSVNG